MVEKLRVWVLDAYEESRNFTCKLPEAQVNEFADFIAHFPEHPDAPTLEYLLRLLLISPRRSPSGIQKWFDNRLIFPPIEGAKLLQRRQQLQSLFNACPRLAINS